MIQEKEFDKILKHIQGVGLLPAEMKEVVRERSNGFHLLGSARRGEESARFSLTVEKNENLGVYELDGYRNTLLAVGEIPHGEVMGIDTAKLEKAMAEINWQNVLPMGFRHDPGIADCIIQLAKISAPNDQQGMKISELLTLKYMEGTPMAMMFNFSELRKQFERAIFVELNGNGQDISFDESYHLLCGRGVAKPMQSGENKSEVCWMVMEDSRVKRVPDFDVASLLSELPFAERRTVLHLAEDVTKLGSGQQIAGRFKIGRQVFNAYYEADPLNGEVAVRDLKQKKLDLQKLANSPQQVKAFPRKSKQERKRLGL